MTTRGRGLVDARTAAEKAFKAATTKAPEPTPKRTIIPQQREQVTLRIDSAVLAHFQEGGPGWQDRINDTLRKAAGLDVEKPAPVTD
jgi:uncharacterized protein (DUF4415 family)